MAAIMFQGTGSDVGKSVLVAGLCRAFANQGLRVLPFKPQNMSNNAAVTTDGGEIGRAQALQALACRAALHSDMNPVLLKPQADHCSQLIVHGQVAGDMNGLNFREKRAALLPKVMESFHRLQAQADLVIIEGAGSPAETNLRGGDIANMGFARAAHVPVVMIGDINRGGVIASLVGTKMVLDDGDNAMIKAFIINKFRGDPALFDDGYHDIAQRTGWQGFGVVPWLRDLHLLPAEDAVVLSEANQHKGENITIACPILPHISNFDDLDPWALEPHVDVIMVPRGQIIPPHADLIILPGSKATISDLAALREQGWDIDIAAHVRRGGMVFGLCGGYQMLGDMLHDTAGIEGGDRAAQGLGHLPVATHLSPQKILRQVSGQAMGAPITGYEMHMGITRPSDASNANTLPAPPAFAMLDDGRSDGAISACQRIFGTYVHGIFASAPFRQALLARLGAQGSGADYHASVDGALNSIADQLTAHLDLEQIAAIAGLKGQP